MDDRQDQLRHDMIAQHAFVQRENSQPSQASVTCNPIDTEAPTSEAHVSLLSSHRIPMSPTHASLHPSSCRLHVSPIQESKVVEVLELPEVPETLEVPETPKHRRQ